VKLLRTACRLRLFVVVVVESSPIVEVVVLQ